MRLCSGPNGDLAESVYALIGGLVALAFLLWLASPTYQRWQWLKECQTEHTLEECRSIWIDANG